MTISVLLSFSLSIRLIIHTRISEMQSSSCFTALCISPSTLGLYVTYSWLSSAYLWYTTPCLRIIRCIGMVYIVNNTGPNTDPWGTPHVSGMVSDMASSILTLCVRASRYISSQESALACTPNSAFSRDSSWHWSIVSKAADKSSMTRATACDCFLYLHDVTSSRQR